MSEVNLFVCCHKDYNDVGIDNQCYKLISDKDIKNDSKLELIKSDGYLDNRLWSELTQLYYIWKHPDLQSDWIGLCHYRRYFEFMNDIPKFDKPVIPKEIVSPFNNYICYSVNHNNEDLLSLYRIIKTNYKEYLKYYILMTDSHYYVPYNMFILPKDLFNEYCEFIFGVLFEFGKIINVNNDYISMIKRIGIKSEQYIKKAQYPNNSYDYQARIFGFLSERLSTAFFFKYKIEHGSDSLQEIPIKITEKTYNKV